MVTLQRIRRMWDERAYGRLSAEVLGVRPEAAILKCPEASTAISAAALTLIRLDELNQSACQLYAQLLRVVMATQQADGGWGDLLTTSLCLRALACGGGDGLALDQGMQYLANLQKPSGIWPAEPLRRMPEDAFTSAYILLQLGGDVRFQEAVDVPAAIDWFDRNEHSLDRPTAQLWSHARRRVGRIARPARMEAALWS